MDIRRRSPLMRFGLSLAFLAGCGGVPAQQQVTDSIVIRNTGLPGSVEIENTGPAISLAGRVLMERLREGTWITANVTFDLVQKCSDSIPECITLDAGQKFTPIAWNGYTCSGQCIRSCRSNHYA